MDNYPMDGETNSRERGIYNFRRPVHERWRDLSSSLLGVLTATRAFQRLRHIRFLGAIDYALIRTPNYKRGNVRHTRFHHSQGVARLALDYATQLELTEHETLTLMTAALLHDIGHSPFSHSLEPIFERLLGVSHHRATIDIITGKTPIGLEVYGVLRDQVIDIDRVLALISGEDNSFHGFFSGPINFDTVEGVFRSFSYIATSKQAPNPHRIIDAAILRSGDKDRELVDLFWSYKDRVYTSVINSRIGLLADYMCQTSVMNAAKSLDINDYFSTDEKLFRRIPNLRRVLCADPFHRVATISLSQPISYKSRRFYIDSAYDFFSRDDTHRYKQVKQTQSLTFGENESGAYQLKQDLFDDDISRQLGLFEWDSSESPKKVERHNIIDR